jgi:3-oxoadipate enol-lactonase
MMALHHQITGPEGAPVLLLGGSLGTDLAMWDGQLALAEQFRLVRFDHRGHGRSPVPSGPYSTAALGRDVLELIDTLALERAAYAGLSLGGMVGIWLAANAPERVDRLVLLCTAAWMPTATAYAARAGSVRVAASTAPVADAVLERWLTPPFAAANPELRERLRAMLIATPAEGYAGCCEAIAAMDLREDLGRITTPTLVISGADDSATPVPLQALIARTVARARHQVVAPAAHLAAVEQPQRINELIGEHLR